jgi:sulfate permease, SulP family
LVPPPPPCRLTLQTVVSQLPGILGLSVPSTGVAYNDVIALSKAITGTNWHAAVLSITAIVFLLTFKLVKRLKRFPAPLFLVVLSTLLSSLLSLSSKGIAVVGEIPRGIPPPQPPIFTLADLPALLPLSGTVVLIGFMESYSVATAYALKNRYRINTNQELFALGATQCLGSFFRAYPVTGSFSRTALTAAVGGRSQIAQLFTGLLLTLVVLFLTPLFHNLPKAGLAAMVSLAVVDVFDVAEFKFLWRVRRVEFLVILTAFTLTLLIGPNNAILICFGASALYALHRSTKAKIMMSSVTSTPAQRAGADAPPAAGIERSVSTPEYRLTSPMGGGMLRDVHFFRFDTEIYFANAEDVKRKMEAATASRGHHGHILVLEMSGCWGGEGGGGA